MTPEKTICLRTFPPNETPLEQTIPVGDLLTRDSFFRPSDWTCERLRSLAEVNRFLLSGSGDDGHFVHRWQPFELSEREYAVILKRLIKTQAERGRSPNGIEPAVGFMRPSLTYIRSVLVASIPIAVLWLCEALGIFLAQLAFPYSHYYRVTHGPYTVVHKFGGDYAAFYAILQWVVVVAVLAWLVRHRSPWQVFLIAAATVVILTLVAHGIVAGLGYEFEFDAL